VLERQAQPIKASSTLAQLLRQQHAAGMTPLQQR
jgi:hypothetical protein